MAIGNSMKFLFLMILIFQECVLCGTFVPKRDFLNDRSNHDSRKRSWHESYTRQESKTHWSRNSRHTPFHGDDDGENFDEERQLALALQLKVIRKMSMKKWIRERHALWPSRPVVERIKVEEWERNRMKVIERQGWPVHGKSDPKFPEARRTNWIKIADNVIQKNTRDQSHSEEVVSI